MTVSNERRCGSQVIYFRKKEKIFNAYSLSEASVCVEFRNRTTFFDGRRLFIK